MRFLWSALGLSFLSLRLLAEPLFEVKGKKYDVKDLPDGLRQLSFEAEDQRFRQFEQIADEAVLDLHVNELMTTQKKSRSEVEASLFSGAQISESEAQLWYGANKGRLGGRTYDSIKNELMAHLRNQKEGEMRRAFIDNLKKTAKFALLLPKPEAPLLNIRADGRAFKGNEKASVVIVEFADYGCPHCKHASESLKKVMDKNKDQVKLVFMDYPLSEGGLTQKIAVGAECARKQNKFWEYHYDAFASQMSFNAEWPEGEAKKLGLNVEEFKKCYLDPNTDKFVASSRDEGERLGVRATPTIFVNGRRVENFEEATLEAEIKSAKR